jgi:hypothetical protein
VLSGCGVERAVDQNRRLIKTVPDRLWGKSSFGFLLLLFLKRSGQAGNRMFAPSFNVEERIVLCQGE